MPFSLDSNVLVYAADGCDKPRQAAAIEIIARAAERDCILTPQALAEFFYATTRKGILPRIEATRQVTAWITVFPVTAGAGKSALQTAVVESAAGRLGFFDAMLLATARDAGCTAVISADMSANTILDGVRVVPAFENGCVSRAADALL